MALQLSITIVFLTAASITLLFTFSLMIGLRGKTLKPSGRWSSSGNFRFLLILVPADISEEVFGGGLHRDEPLLEETVFVAVCCGIWWAAEFTSEVLLLYTGLFERWLLFDDISPRTARSVMRGCRSPRKTHHHKGPPGYWGHSCCWHCSVLCRLHQILKA